MRVNYWLSRGRALLLITSLVALGVSGCAVLTPSQVKEVKRFAQAAEIYDTLPGAVTEAHAELRKRERVFLAAGLIPGPIALPQIESALKAQREHQIQANRANKALDVLDQYARLLVTLTAENFSEDQIGRAHV